MSFATYANISDKTTPQTEPIPGTAPNNAGGQAYPVDDWIRFERFLVLGSEGGTYYVGARKLTLDNAAAVRRCIEQDPKRAADLILAISREGRAPKNDPALFALALMASSTNTEARRQASIVLPFVARIGTHLFHFAAFVDEHRGWGRGLRSMIADWYTSQSPEHLALQLVKYQQRDGWSHRDLLRLTHAKSARHNDLFHWAVKGWDEIGPEEPEAESLRIIWAFERAKRSTDALEVAGLIYRYNLPREAVPTPMLNERVAWEALLQSGQGMPMTALIRNLATMTRVGLIAPMGPHNAGIASRLTDGELLRKARVHPLQMLVALRTYQQGHGEKGKNTWGPESSIVDALDKGFYASFGNVEPTGKRILLALDVSGSMGSPEIVGMPGISPRVGAAAMALVTANVEPNRAIVGFTASSDAGRYLRRKTSTDGDGISVLAISPSQRLDDVVKYLTGMPFGATDCALPMLWALANKVPVDAFVIYTDSETWAGSIHPKQALDRYRAETGIPAKLIVVGMVSNEFSIADPEDAGMLDVVGFDTATPNLISDFIRR